MSSDFVFDFTRGVAMLESFRLRACDLQKDSSLYA
jgi:hypothetical protein